MKKEKTHRIDHRIVSISKLHVRPLVRGKAKDNMEFSSKVDISFVDGPPILYHESKAEA